MKSISRRDFLKGTLGFAGLTIAASVTPLGYEIVNASNGKRFSPSVFYEVTPDNLVTVYIPSSEMGQGIKTALAMIIAEELDADWKNVRVVQAPAEDCFRSPILHDQVTVASASIRAWYAPMRKAGAAGRYMLVEAAASKWKVPKDQCTSALGVVKHAKTGRTLTYGKLCMDAAKADVPKDVPLKSEKDFRYMGKPMARLDIPEKVSGKGVFGLDFHVDGMVYAVIARPPAYGAKPLSFDDKGALQVKGVEKVVQVPMGIAVCAKTTDAAIKGRDALKVSWGKGVLPDMDSEYVEKSLFDDLKKPLVSVVKQGDAKKAIDGAAKKVGADYYVPCIAHATMEPMNTTASVKADRCDVWSPTQAQTATQGIAMKITGLPKEKVHVHTTLLGCGLGRRARPDFVAEAVTLSKVVGKPVKVVWTREDDIKYDAFRAPAAHRVEAGVDSSGKLVGWSHKVVSPSILKDIAPPLIKGGFDIFCLWGIADLTGPVGVNNRLQYVVPNMAVDFLISSLPMPVSPWRSVQNGPNAFVIESFIDELARAAGKDPLEFRLQNLKGNKRATRVLELAAEKAGWGKPIPKGEGRGIAQHACFGAWVAQVADISVDRKDGTIKVHRVVAAVDCGPVVNPGPLVTQVEGAIVMSIGTALKEEIKFAKGGVASANFNDYPIMRMSEAPEIEVHIVKSDDPIGGIGEPGIPPGAPAVANAFFNATGVRIRRLPLSPKTVLAALKQS